MAQALNQKNINITITGSYSVHCNVTYAKSSSGGSDDDEFADAERSCDCGTVVYPNPVSDILSIEVGHQISENASAYNQDTTYDIRLYNGQGNMVR